jgi:group II intron reverse transcriptase/maturase
MSTSIDRIATKARKDKQFCFTSLAHHITQPLLAESLSQVKAKSSPGIDDEDVATAKASFDTWSKLLIDEVHRRGYRPQPAKRIYIPKPGKSALRPIALPTVKDKVMQRAVAKVLNAIYEEDFLNTSFGGRPGRSAHQAVATLRQGIMQKRVNWVYEADLKNFFGSLDHGWVEKFLTQRVADPRITTLIKRWLKIGVMEADKHIASEEGTAQGSPISVLISNIYLHYVLDLWIEKVVKPRMQGEVIYIRYLDDFILCFQHHGDAMRFQRVIEKRLAKFSLTLEQTKTRLVRFGRFAREKMCKDRKVKPETLYFLGFTFYCGQNKNGGFKVGVKTEKSRLRRSCINITELLKRIRHLLIRVQAKQINQVLRGHYQYYGMADNWDSIKKFHYHVVRTWRKWLSTRSQNGKLSWVNYKKLLKLFPLQRPCIKVPYGKLRKLALL